MQIPQRRIDDRYYLVVAVEPGEMGPYETSSKAEKDKTIGLKAGRYIRVRRDSRLPIRREEFELLKKFADYCFSSELNETATIDDLSYYTSIIPIHVYVQKAGRAFLTVKYDGVTYIDNTVIICTSTNTDYVNLLDWFASTVEASDWYKEEVTFRENQGLATPVAKIAAFADYIAYHYAWENNCNMYCFMNGKGGDCAAATGVILTYVRYLGDPNVTAWSTHDNFEDNGHVYVKFTYGGHTYGLDAGFSRNAYEAGAGLEFIS